MNRIVSIIAASALISAGLVGGLAAANGSRAAAAMAAAETGPAWTSPPAIEAGCHSACDAASPARKVRVIAIDGRDWPAGQAARKTASR